MVSEFPPKNKQARIRNKDQYLPHKLCGTTLNVASLVRFLPPKSRAHSVGVMNKRSFECWINQGRHSTMHWINMSFCACNLYIVKNRRSRRSAKPDFCPFSLNYFLENFVRAFGANKLKYKNFFTGGILGFYATSSGLAHVRYLHVVYGRRNFYDGAMVRLHYFCFSSKQSLIKPQSKDVLPYARCITLLHICLIAPVLLYSCSWFYPPLLVWTDRSCNVVT